MLKRGLPITYMESVFNDVLTLGTVMLSLTIFPLMFGIYTFIIRQKCKYM